MANPRRGSPRDRKSILRRPVDIDEKDFLDMILAEANEEETALLLGEPAPQDIWQEPYPEPEGKKDNP